MGDPPKTPPKSTKIFEGLFLEISPQNIFQHVFFVFQKIFLEKLWGDMAPTFSSGDLFGKFIVENPRVISPK